MNTDNQIVRVRLVETDDGDRRQAVRAEGRAREMFGGQKRKIPRNQEYGFSTHAPKGSVGTVIVIGGHPDQAMVANLEHPDHRPTDLEEGEVKIYSKFGQVIHLKANGDIAISAPGDITIASGGTVHINP